MDLKDKKDLILNYVRLGMDFHSSALAISCTKEDIEIFETDEDFQKAVKVNHAILEKDL